MITIDFKHIIDIATISALLGLSLYHFLIYRGRRKYKDERYNLYFTLFSFCTAVYLYLGSPLFIYETSFAHDYDYLVPPIECTVILGIFFGFTNFFSKLLKYPAEKIKVLKYAFYYLCASLSLSLMSIIVSWKWYIRNLLIFVVVLGSLYVLFLAYSYGTYIIKNKSYKDSIIKVILTGIFILISYLLLVKLSLFISPLELFRQNNIVVLVVVYIFSYAIASGFNREYDELTVLKDNLENKIIERTSDLSKAKEDIERISREKTDFFVNLSHEIKTPVTIINNYLQKYIIQYGKNDEIMIIKRNIDKLCKDMTAFLDSEKLLRGSISYDNVQEINFSELLNEKIILFGEYAGKKNIKMLSCVEDNLYMKADPYIADGIIFNLLENAIKYTPSDRTVDVKLNCENDDIVFIVSDTGSGIPKDKLRNIFEPYYQVSHQKSNIQGMGMGLFLVKKYVELIKGTINVESTESKGSTFTVRFPGICPAAGITSYAAQIEPFISSEKIKEIKEEPGKKNILIVEDNTDMLNFLIDEFISEYNVCTSRNGFEALEKINSMPLPSVIISDIMMDKMDGIEFFNRISTDTRFCNIPFIFLTAKNEYEEKIRMLRAGAYDFISKPFLAEELKAKVNTILLNSSRQKEKILRDTIEVIKKELVSSDEREPENPDVFYERCNQYGITDRQKEIILLVSEGLEYKEIAGKLNISNKTVARHIENLFDKLNVHNKIDLLNTLFR